MAESLGKFKHEVEQLSCDEFDGWWEYFKWKSKETEKLNKKHSQSSGKGSKRTTKI